MKKIISILITISLVFSLSACSKKEDDSSSKDTGYTVTDSRGKEITFDKEPEKIISLLASDTEIIYALGSGDKLIAVDNYSNYPTETKDKKKLDSGAKTNIEAVIGLNPDVIFLGQMDQTEDQVKQLENAGIKVILTNAISIADSYKVIDMIGKALNKQAKATEIINGMKKDFDDIKAQAKGKTSKKVYIEISPLQYKLWTCGKGTFRDELFTLVGATNIFADINSYAEVSEEQVLSRNPEIIISTAGPMYTESNAIDEIKGRANWNKIDAVKNGKIFETDSDAIQRPGPRLVQAAKDLMKILYE